MMNNLHPVQEKLLTVLIDTMEEPLTIRALQETLDLSSPSVVYHHIQQLEKKGYLRRNPANPKDYQVLKDDPEKSITYLNLYGLAKCGPEGTLLDGNPVDRIPISSRLLGFRSEEAFMVRAKGSSMMPKIAEGDYLICRRTSNARNGAIVVCALNGETMVKRLQYETTGPVVLSSLNPIYDPIVVDIELLKIEGVVKAVLNYL